MRQIMITLLGDRRGTLRLRVAGLICLLLLANLGAWAWAFRAFGANPALLGTALLAYTFGLRHAVDADHIAAIDNVTRKLMQAGKRPAAVGFYFSLGHSTIVVLASVAIAATATAFQSRMDILHGIGGIIGTSISASFLLAIAAMNLVVLAAVYRTFRHVKAEGTYQDEDLDMLLAGRGLLARLFRPMIRMITRSWHMYPLGVLFGLGFDTATEIGLLGISTAQASQGLSIWAILVFPALFAAGMSLIDTADSVLMLGAYGWAFVKPVRKLYYNMTVTLVSVVVALAVGGIEALGLLQGQLDLKGPVWDWIGVLNDNFGVLGYVIIGVFVATLVISTAIYRLRRYDRLEA